MTLCLETFCIVKTGFVDDVGRFGDFFYTHRPSVHKVFSISVCLDMNVGRPL